MKSTEVQAYRPEKLPPLLKLSKGTGTTPTEEFGRLYNRLVRMVLDEVYTEESHWRLQARFTEREVQKPSRDPQEFLQRLYKSPDLEQEYAREYFTYLQELDRKKWKENGYDLGNIQRADLALTPMMMATGKRTEYAAVLYGNPANTGKTMLLGIGGKVEMRRGERRIQQGEDPGLGIFVTSKPTLLGQQSMGLDQRTYASPPYMVEQKDINRFYKDCSEIFGDDFTQSFPRPLWKELFDPKYAHVEGREIIEEVLTAHGLWAKFKKRYGHDEMFGVVAGIVGGDLLSVKGIYNDPVFIETPPRPKGDVNLSSYDGDATFWIPERFPVHAGHKDVRLKGAEQPKDPRFMLDTASIFMGQRKLKNREYLNKLTLVGYDEIRNSPMSKIRHAAIDSGAKRPPIIEATTRKDLLTHTDSIRLPRKSVAECIQEGVLGDIGYEVFPGDDEELVTQGTEEAYRQFEERFFAQHNFLKDLGLKQPFEVDTLAVAPTSHVREYAHRILRRFEELHGKDMHEDGVELDNILTFDGAVGQDKSRIELWFKTRTDRVKVLFSSAGELSEAWDFPNLGRVILGAKVDEATRGGLFERLSHSTLFRRADKKERSAFRGYFSEQIFANSIGTLARNFPHGTSLPQQGFSMVPMHVLLSQRGFRADEKRLQSRHKKLAVRIPDAGAKVSPATKVVGTPLKTTSPFVIEKERMAEERRQKKLMARYLSGELTDDDELPAALLDGNGHGPDTRGEKRAPQKTDAKPGSYDKLEEMARRVAAGQSLFHKEDNDSQGEDDEENGNGFVDLDDVDAPDEVIQKMEKKKPVRRK